jgi:hypothetical protein
VCEKGTEEEASQLAWEQPTHVEESFFHQELLWKERISHAST